MSIVINGTGSISGIAVGGLPDGTVDAGTLATNSVDSAELIDGAVDAAHLASGVGGKVLQVVSVTKTDTFSSSTTSWTDITGFTATITPTSTSSKIFVTVTGYAGGDTNRFAYLKVQRNGTDVGIGDSRNDGTPKRCLCDLGDSPHDVDVGYAFTGSFLDSPASTSALTYKTQMWVIAGTYLIGGSKSESDGNRSATPSTITLMEIGV
jgi:hypothetical protein